MQRLLVLTVLAIIFISSCESSRTVSGQPQRLSVTISAPTGVGVNAPGLFGQETARFSAAVIGVNGPFELDWNFGGAASNEHSTLAVAGTATIDVTLVGLAMATDFTATVTVTDSAGVSQSDSVTFTVGEAQNMSPETEEDFNTGTGSGEPRGNTDPVFTSVEHVAGNVFVTTEDAEGDYVILKAELLSGDVDLAGPFRETGEGAEFHLFPQKRNISTDFELRLKAFDIYGGKAEQLLSGSIEPFSIRPDSIYAMPAANKLFSGEDVLVTVSTGKTANPFQYMNGVTLSCDPGAEYVAKSLDFGSADEQIDSFGPVDPLDGVWAAVNPQGFLRAPDEWHRMEGNGTGLDFISFNITPLFGSDTTAGGDLFNFRLAFNEVGTYRLGFQTVYVVSRTYYQDSTASADFFWSDDSNLHPFNTIVVEE